MGDNIITTALSMLGCKAVDKITGLEGFIASVNFDAYGCVQVLLTPRVGSDGKLADNGWFDIKRIDVKERMMNQPNFQQTKYGEENGGNKLPPLSSPPMR